MTNSEKICYRLFCDGMNSRKAKYYLELVLGGSSHLARFIDFVGVIDLGFFEEDVQKREVEVQKIVFQYQGSLNVLLKKIKRLGVNFVLAEV